MACAEVRYRLFSYSALKDIILFYTGLNVTLTSTVYEVLEGRTFDVCVSREEITLQMSVQITLIITEQHQGQ